MKTFTIYSRKGVTIYKRVIRGVRDVHEALQLYLTYDTGFEPFAWTEGTHETHPLGKTSDMRKEAVALGRRIDYVDGNYVAHVPGEEPAATPFRIGGIYRQRCGDLVRLVAPFMGVEGAGERRLATYGLQRHEIATAKKVAGCTGNDGGWHELGTGRYIAGRANPDHPGHLLPGEVDEQGRPLAPTLVQEAAAIAREASYEPRLKKATPAAPAARLEDSTDPKDLAMLRRDGPAKEPTAKPAFPRSEHPRALPNPFAAFRSPDLGASDHRVAPAHGSAKLGS